ncbi:LysR family transcriptional regulator [Derxia lacustris]|uniref:LysR family transcriptional regulator n=1 Tax=Derxia lacustris TaxID=764842 RepID=UPI000A17196C|nr:LysR family transcriptional regulator [Derxia lacustris]
MDRLAAMQTFIAVVEAGSLSAGAQRLGVGQPAVSKTVAQLEARLGVALLLRSPRGIALTEAGRQFHEHARRAVEEAEAAELAARGAGAALTGRLRVCAPVTLARLHVLPRLQPFLLEHPQLALDLVLDDRDIDLREEGIDVAIRMGQLADSTMTARRLARGRRMVVGTPGYFARAGLPQHPAELAAHQAIVFNRRGGGTAWSFERAGTEVSVVVAGRVQTGAAEGVRAAVLCDLGLAIASEWMFAPELASGAARQVLADWALPPVDLWAVYPSGRRASAKARAFAAYVERLMADTTAAN